MNAKRLFEDDEFLFGDGSGDAGDGGESSGDRESHIELRIDPDRGDAFERHEPYSTLREIVPAVDYFSCVPRLAVSAQELALLPLDHREGFLIACVDGVSTIETILDVSAMPAEEALVILESLVERGVLLIPR
jgi:hypothetical protein